jgi:hypothetical protein
MTNEMKLLTALCDALGFDVEEVQEQSIPSGQVLIPHGYKLTKRVIDAEIEWGKSVGILDGNGDHKQ